jgi:hypothetical protein
MSHPVGVIGIEKVLLEDSYVLGFSRRNNNIFVEMEFTLASLGPGHLTVGNMVFPEVAEEDWYGSKVESSSIEEINLGAHRYYGGPDERPDLGTIASIRFVDGKWHIVGDWGEARLHTRSQPCVEING